jgi:hypothetical protein
MLAAIDSDHTDYDPAWSGGPPLGEITRHKLADLWGN